MLLNCSSVWCDVLADESWRRQLAQHALLADRASPCCWSLYSYWRTAQVDILCKVCRLQCFMPKHYRLSFWSRGCVSTFLTTRRQAFAVLQEIDELWCFLLGAFIVIIILFKPGNKAHKHKQETYRQTDRQTDRQYKWKKEKSNTSCTIKHSKTHKNADGHTHRSNFTIAMIAPDIQEWISIIIFL